MTFREFVELTRDAVQAVAFGLEGDRDMVPMLLFDTDVGLHCVTADASFFQGSEAVRGLAERYLVPLIKENGASKAAWTFCAWTAPPMREVEIDQADGSTSTEWFYCPPSEHPDRREMLLATFIDPEVIEHWAAPIVRTGGPVLVGNWTSSLPNVGGGPLLTTIQKAMR